MKTKVLLLALLSGFVFSVAAQKYQPRVGLSNEAGYKTNSKKNKARDSWFISIAGGVSVLLEGQNGEVDLKNRLNLTPQVSFGEWLDPYLGFHTQLNGGIIHGFEGDDVQFMQHDGYVATYVGLLWDVTDFWAPYRGSRVSRLIPWVGLGYTQRLKTTESYDRLRAGSPTSDADILTVLRLSKRVDLNVKIQGSLLNEQSNRARMDCLADGIVWLSAGLTFKLDKTDFEVLEPTDYTLLNDLDGQINSLRVANDELNKRSVSCLGCQETVTEAVNNHVDSVVHPHINSAGIDKDQQTNTYNTVEFMKNNNALIKVVGYTDEKAGISDYNMGLSEKRARVIVKEPIGKYGISSSQITIEWKGSDEQPYGENNWNRVVIVSTNN